MKDDSVRDKALEKLVGGRLRAGLKPATSNCLDAGILAAYVERTLTPRERADCESHISSCANCQEQVAALVRLSEADEPVQVQVAAAAPARPVRASWFRLAFAGPVLAAVLVAGIYFVGPFKDVIQQVPEVRQPTRPAAPPTSNSTKSTEQDKGAPAVAADRVKEKTTDSKALYDERRIPVPAEKKAASLPATAGSRSELGRTTTTQTVITQDSGEPKPAPPTPPKSAGAEGQVISRNEPTPQPVPSAVNVPARSREIATPSVRADIAQEGPGEDATAGGGAGAGAGTRVGGISGGLVNGLARKDAKDDDNARSKPKRMIATAEAAKKEAGVAKTQRPNEAPPQADSTSTNSATAEVRDHEQRKQKAIQMDEVSASTQTLQVQSEISAPTWRVGRHGLIEQRDSNGKLKKHKSGVKADLNDISFASPDVGWAVGQAGTILRSTDGGKSWVQLASPTSEDLVHVTAESDTAASVATRTGETLSTADGGTTWNREPQ